MSTLSRQASTTPALDVGSAGPSIPRARRTGPSASNTTARAGPSTGNNNVIDLTSSSPPTSNRALPPAAGPSNGLRLPAPTPAPRRDGLRARGSARATGSGTRDAAEVIELSSDEEEAVVVDDSDGELVVQGARAGPSRQRATTSSSNTAEARLVSRFAPDGDRERYRAEQARMLADARATAQRRRDAAAAARRAEDDEIYGLGGGAAGGYGGAFNYGGGAGIYGLYQLLAQGVAGGVGGGGGGMLDYGALLGYGGDGIPGGLQGLYGAGGGGAGNAGWGGAERVKKGKKYGPRMSHPHKIEQGFARDIIELPDPDDPPPPPAKRKKGSKAPAPAAKPELLEPVCSSCLEPLLLAQSGSQRPWALRCGHVVCGGCIGSARKRVEAAKRKEREIVLGSDDEMDGGAGSESDGELKYVGDSSDDEEEGDEAITGRRATRTRRAAATKAKSKTLTSSRVKATSANTKPITLSKGKAKSLPTDVDSSWTTCPIVNCGGDKTNLGKDVGEGAVEGAWELFV